MECRKVNGCRNETEYRNGSQWRESGIKVNDGNEGMNQNV